MQFAPHTPFPEYFKDDLMMVIWPKHAVKVKINKKLAVLCWTDT
jgi:hypothetical protein